ncbi:hypothetical protein PI124_g20544 [Phytophthora idaei]|nr:hypothetical protein PI124_g20544 [Phytophthora idaei]
MPVHVGLAKEVTRLIDEASSVFVTSEDELEEEKRPPPGQRQTPRPALGPPGTPPAPTAALLTTADSPTVAENPGEVEESSRASQGGVCADTFDGYDSTETLPPFSLSDDEEPPIDELRKKEATQASSTAASATPQAPSSNSKAPLTADAPERLRYPKLPESSDGLGGVNLTEMRDTMQQRTYSGFEEASYTKQKRLKAEKAVAEMKRKLEDASEAAADSCTNLVKNIMVLRADAERAEAARAEISGT